MIRIVRNPRGFSLLEVLIGLIFLAVGLLAVGSMQITSTRGGFFSSSLMQATYIGQDGLEFLKGIGLTDARLSDGDHPNGSARIPDIPGGMVFNRSYNVTTVNDPNGNYLRINYVVTWDDGVAHRISFTTIRSQ